MQVSNEQKTLDLVLLVLTILKATVPKKGIYRYVLLDNLCYSCTYLAPPRVAFQLFAEQAISLLHFGTKNKV